MKVSIIIPVYNTDKYIGRCLDSILGQTLKDIEVIIVNDKTPDKAMEIVKKYVCLDNRVHMLEHEKNRGTYAARETGYEAATGDYITFVDSDDYLPRNALEILYNTIEQEGADLVCGAAQRVSAKGLEGEEFSRLSLGTDVQSIYKSLLSEEMEHSLWAKIYKRSLFENQNYDSFENLTNGEDAVLFYQIVKNVKYVKLIDDVVYYYYLNDTSSTRSPMKEDKIRQYIFSLYYCCDHVRDIKELEPFILQRKVKSFLAILRMNCDKKIIRKYARLPDFDQLSTWETLSFCYSGLELLINYLTFNSSITRKIINLARKVKRILER